MLQHAIPAGEPPAVSRYPEERADASTWHRTVMLGSGLMVLITVTRGVGSFHAAIDGMRLPGRYSTPKQAFEAAWQALADL